MNKAYYDIGDLNPGIVNVSLHLDPLASRSQNTLKRIAEYRIANMADVRRFVWVYRCVFDTNLWRRRHTGKIGRRQRFCGRVSGDELRPVQENVQITRS